MWGAERSSGRNCPVSAIYIQSLTTGEIPGDWKCANVTPVLKKGSKKEACNYIYRPVPLTSLPCKILEHIIFHHIMGHLDVHHVLVNYQHGFRRGHSCESQPITIVEHLTSETKTMANRLIYYCWTSPRHLIRSHTNVSSRN